MEKGLIGYLLVTLFTSLSMPENIWIGGILNDEVEESAFRLAVDFVNERQLLGVNVTLKYIANISDTYSSFSIMQVACYQASRGVVAFIGPRSSENTHAMSAISRAMTIPHISPSATDHVFEDHIRFPYLLRMLPPDTMQSYALIALITAIGWTRITILTANTEYGMHWLLQFQSLAAEKGFHILNFQYFEVTSIPEEIDVTAQLKVIRTSGGRVVLLNCLSVLGERVIQTAYDEGMLGPGWAWIVTERFTGSIQYSEKLPNYMSGLIGIQPSTGDGKLWTRMEERWEAANSTIYPGTGGQLMPLSANVMDAVLTNAYGIRDMLNNRVANSFASRKRDCLNDTLASGSTLIEYMKSVVGDGVASEIKFNTYGSPSSPTYDIVNMQSGVWKKVGKWTEGRLSFNATKVTYPGNRLLVNEYKSLLVNKTLRVVTMKEDPFVIITAEEFNPWDIEKGHIEGLVIDLLDRLKELGGFNYTLYYAPDRLYGKKDETTFQWNGLINEVYTKRADIAAAPLTISLSRETDVDFTTPYLDLGMRFILKVPEVEAQGTFKFLEPFHYNVWMMTLLMMFIVGVYVSILNKLSPYDYHGGFVYTDCNQGDRACRKVYRKIKRIKVRSISALSFSNAIWFCIGTLLHQGGEHYPKSISACLAMMSWLFAIVIIISTYTANLAAFLTSSRMKTVIDSIEDLGSQNKIKYGTVRNTAIQKFFEDSNVTLYRNMFINMEEKDTYVNSSDQAVNQARKGGYAFIYDSSILAYLVQRKPCNTIMNVGKLFGKIGYGLALQKNSPFKDELSYYILQLREQGYIEKLVHKWFREKGECSQVDEPKSKEGTGKETGKLSISQMFGIFLVLSGGMVLGTVCLFIEWVVATRLRVDKQDQFAPGSFSESLTQRMNAVRKDFQVERRGDCTSKEFNIHTTTNGNVMKAQEQLGKRTSSPSPWVMAVPQTMTEDSAIIPRLNLQPDYSITAKSSPVLSCHLSHQTNRVRRSSL